MEWKERIIDLGTLHINTEKSFSFESITSLVDVQSITSSCSCTTLKYDSNVIIGKFKTGSFPKHLQDKDSYTTNKFITVTYKSGLKDVLTITAKIVK